MRNKGSPAVGTVGDPLFVLYYVDMKKRLYRSTDNAIIAGVLGGLAEYYEHDPVIWRLAFVVFLILTGLMPGILIYILFWVVVPERPLVEPVDAADYTVYN